MLLILEMSDFKNSSIVELRCLRSFPLRNFMSLVRVGYKFPVLLDHWTWNDLFHSERSASLEALFSISDYYVEVHENTNFL